MSDLLVMREIEERIGKAADMLEELSDSQSVIITAIKEDLEELRKVFENGL